MISSFALPARGLSCLLFSTLYSVRVGCRFGWYLFIHWQVYLFVHLLSLVQSFILQYMRHLFLGGAVFLVGQLVIGVFIPFDLTFMFSFIHYIYTYIYASVFICEPVSQCACMAVYRSIC